jgi:hypothetical protein
VRIASNGGLSGGESEIVWQHGDLDLLLRARIDAEFTMRDLEAIKDSVR